MDLVIPSTQIRANVFHNQIPTVTNQENIAELTKETERLANLIATLKKHLRTMQNKLIDEEYFKQKIEANIKELSIMLETEMDLLAKSSEEGAGISNRKFIDLHYQVADLGEGLIEQNDLIGTIVNDIKWLTRNLNQCESKKICVDEKLEMLTKSCDGTNKEKQEVINDCERSES